MWPFNNKKLEDILFKKVVVHGVQFKIKKLDPTNFLDGSRVMLQTFDVYRLNKPSEESAKISLEKIKDHYRDVFMSSIVEPKVKRKEEGEGLFIDNLFTDWDLSHELYGRIMEYTYGKKKMKKSSSQERMHQS